MKIIKEFKEFISKGNVIDMAVGVIIGGAFTAIVTSLVQDILTPIITAFTKDIKFAELQWKGIMYGNFINAVITFLLTAIVIFSLIKAINKMKREKPEEPAAPTTKVCPYCKSEIDIEATKCPHCTSDVE